jgi:hypothetical protein
MYKQFKTRYFNQITYDINTNVLVKKSSNIEKLRAEYEFYQALPENLKEYFVVPNSYIETNNYAQYNLAYIPAEDAAIQHISNNLSRSSYDRMMLKVSKFLDACPVEVLPENSMKAEAYNLVISKSKYRIGLLESNPIWINSIYRKKLEDSGLTTYKLLEILEERFNFFIQDRITWNKRLSHGDLCLSNILWSDEANIFKLIDPKGVESMYLDEYYDIAKLCHSIVGNYDDIIYENYVANYDDLSIKITREEDVYFWDTFRSWVIDRNISFELQRIYQVSIFISMLPNHIEDDARVGAFILNAYNHLKTLGYRG